MLSERADAKRTAVPCREAACLTVASSGRGQPE
jgi:hypothetical protein